MNIQRIMQQVPVLKWVCLQRMLFVIRHIVRDEREKNGLHRGGGLIKLAWLLKHNTQIIVVHTLILL
jgi:hypothetical protein